MEGRYTVHIVTYNIHINISTDTKMCQGALSLTESFSGRRHLPPSGMDVVIRILALCRQGSHILPSCAFAATFTHSPLTPTFSISFNTPFKPKKLIHRQTVIFDMEKQHRRPLSEKQRLQIRQYAAQNSKLDQRSLARWASSTFDRHITQSMISRTLSQSYSYLDTKVFQKREKDGNKRRIPPQYPQLEAALFDWVVTMEDQRLTVTGDLIRSAASQIWARMPEYKDIEEPKWSEGWLNRFKHRHNIRKRRKYGESGSVDVEGAQERLKEI